MLGQTKSEIFTCKYLRSERKQNVCMSVRLAPIQRGIQGA